MKRKSGLHKKVSSIFDGVPIPGHDKPSAPAKENSPAQQQPGTPETGTAVKPPMPKPIRQKPQPPAKPKPHLTPATKTDEEIAYAKKQKKMAIVMAPLFIILIIVLYPSFKPAKKTETPAAGTTTETIATAAQDKQLTWQKPNLIALKRDPMVVGKVLSTAATNPDAPLERSDMQLKGIMFRNNGKSSVLINQEILKTGQKINGWTVKSIGAESVDIQNEQGQTHTLKY